MKPDVELLRAYIKSKAPENEFNALWEPILDRLSHPIADLEGLKNDAFNHCSFDSLANRNPHPLARSPNQWDTHQIMEGARRMWDYLASRRLIGRGWMPIETAPRDKTPFIGYSPTHGVKSPVSFSEQRNDFDIGGFSSLKRDWTHWQPLPAAPDDGGEK